MSRLFLALLLIALASPLRGDDETPERCPEYEALETRETPLRPVVSRAYRLTPANVVTMVTGPMHAQGYTDIEVAGMGGMAVVIRATDRQGNRKAFKILHTASGETLTAIEREAELMQYLHQKDARFLNARRFVLENNGVRLVGIEMEAAPGRPLDSLIREGYFAQHPQHRAEVMRQLQEWVRLAHENGVWHQDIKPDNILVDIQPGGQIRVTLIDWGIAYHAPSAGGPGRIYPASDEYRQGTPAYVAEEIWMGDRASEISDVNALRMVDWEMREVPGLPRGVARRLLPNSLPPAQEAETIPKMPLPKFVSTDGSHDEDRPSGMKFVVPAVAWDDKGTPAERQVAMAEFSTTPRTVAERQQLLEKARSQDPSTFLREHADRLRAAATRESSITDPHVREILASSFLIENLRPDGGLQMSRAEIDQIARKAADMFVATRRYNVYPAALKSVGPHHLLRYSEMKDQVDNLFRAGLLTKGWENYVMGAIQRSESRR